MTIEEYKQELVGLGFELVSKPTNARFVIETDYYCIYNNNLNLIRLVKFGIYNKLNNYKFVYKVIDIKDKEELNVISNFNFYKNNNFNSITECFNFYSLFLEYKNIDNFLEQKLSDIIEKNFNYNNFIYVQINPDVYPLSIKLEPEKAYNYYANIILLSINDNFKNEVYDCYLDEKTKVIKFKFYNQNVWDELYRQWCDDNDF